MPNANGMSRAQTKFLKAFRTAPFGPNVGDWPSPAVFRRWLRKPGFVNAMRSVRDAIRYQADFQLLSAAGAAAHVMHTSVTSGSDEDHRGTVASLSHLLKLLHVRERFQKPEPPRPFNPGIVTMYLGGAHPDLTVGTLREHLMELYGIDVRETYLQAPHSAGKQEPWPGAAMAEARRNGTFQAILDESARRAAIRQGLEVEPAEGAVAGDA